MKNVHVLPTDKPSRLHFDDKLFLSTSPQISKNINSIVEGRNIYITSEKEIKEGDWVITPTNDVIQWAKVFQPDGKKIILTTDQDLINDGVQPIDDEFLDWFFKNPNCEEVEIENGWGLEIDIETPYYKIIIPKEEQTTEEQLPTKWFKTEEIDTWVGDSTDGGRGKLVVLHQCGENKEELISQLKTLINGIESDFEWFAQ
jgi:hypothetical protein